MPSNYNKYTMGWLRFKETTGYWHCIFSFCFRIMLDHHKPWSSPGITGQELKIIFFWRRCNILLLYYQIPMHQLNKGYSICEVARVRELTYSENSCSNGHFPIKSVPYPFDIVGIQYYFPHHDKPEHVWEVCLELIAKFIFQSRHFPCTHSLMPQHLTYRS